MFATPCLLPSIWEPIPGRSRILKTLKTNFGHGLNSLDTSNVVYVI